MAYKPNDHYARRARDEHYAARSVYKLQELDRRYRLFRPGQRVLDLGASPGSWSQYASQRVAASGHVVGIDLKPVSLSLPNAEFMQIDIADLPDSGSAGGRFDLVISDMAPATTGNKLTDQARSYALCLLAWQAARDRLVQGGHFVCKMFESEDTPAFRDALKPHFGEVHLNRPRGTQKGSKEIFLVGQRFAG